MKILIVDDARVTRRIIIRSLSDAGFDPDDFIETTNGKEALDVMSKQIDDIVLVIIDLNMPDMDGFQLLDLMEQNGSLPKTSVLIISGTVDSTVLTKLKAFNIKGILKKPFTAAKLVDYVERIFND